LLESHVRHRLRAYRAYNIDTQPVNLSSQEIAESNAIIATYGAFDGGVGPNAWNQREIPIADVCTSSKLFGLEISFSKRQFLTTTHAA
jgi:hypothetical protein